MTACSSAELEPGPIEPLPEDAIVGPPDPPVFTPLAKEFQNDVAGFHGAFDDAIALLAAESTIDVAGGILDGLDAGARAFSSTVNAEALAHLQTAEDGFRVARDKTASLVANVPADVQQPANILSTFLVFSDAAGARVPGALVTIDADFGNGTTRTTDGNGRVNFGLPQTGTISWTLDAPGRPRASGVLALNSQLAYFITIGAA